MLVVIPYPNGEKYIAVMEEVPEEVTAMRKQILDYVSMVCSGPWESDNLDILHNGIRVRLGCEKDYFMLQLKYGKAEEYK